MAIVRFLAGCSICLSVASAPAADPVTLTRADGYRGCWYAVGATKDEYAYKYSGGLATYPQQHAPIAIYCEAVKKTFFVYGGKNPAANSILHMVSYFDHETKTVPRPAILLDKKTDDAHDNPTLAVDRDGHLWVFSNAHGTARPSYVHRGVKPYSIEAFEKVSQTNFSYACPWVLPDGRFVLMHTKYANGRGLHVAVSPDGRTWPEPTPFAKIEAGDYQISAEHNGTVATAFDHHPTGKGLDSRTNLYYLASTDGAKTWRTADGTAITLPVSSSQTPALVRDFAAEKKLVYLKDLAFDAAGRPVILFLTSTDHKPGPAGGPHEWHTARWDGSKWQFRPVTTSDHNYDHGSLYLEADGTWRIVAPFGPGPQPFGTGGEMQVWVSADRGESWAKVKDLTAGSTRNHTYARRPRNAHPDFYAIWADGDARKKSESDLFVSTKAGEVFRLPRTFTGETTILERVK
jgi:hypothetical protein